MYTSPHEDSLPRYSSCVKLTVKANPHTLLHVRSYSAGLSGLVIGSAQSISFCSYTSCQETHMNNIPREAQAWMCPSLSITYREHVKRLIHKKKTKEKKKNRTSMMLLSTYSSTLLICFWV